MICKFDNEVECNFYLCEEDCSSLEMYEDQGKSCPLFAKVEKLDVAVYKANKILSDWCKECEHDTFGSECENDCKIIDLKRILQQGTV